MLGDSLYDLHFCIQRGQQKKGALFMRKNPLTKNPLLCLLLMILYFPIGVIMALAKNYK